MDSELVQRLQTQLLDLRTENCDFKEKCKFLDSKVKKISNEKEEIEKELKLNQRKTKAFSFLPGQSSRDEIIKLENEIEAKNKALEEQEVDFQKHDETLRNEIANLQRQISTMESRSKSKNMKKSDSKTSMNSINHPLNRSDDSAIDIEELEKNLAAEIDKNAIIESEKKEKTKAIRELEAMVKQLRKDKEDLKIKSSEYESTVAKLKESEELAEKRKITSDNLAKEVSQLKHQLKEIEQQAKANLIGKQVVSEKDELIQRMKQQIKDHEGHSKVSEVKIIEAGRRIDQLIDQNNEYQKTCRAHKQTRDFIERSFDELKEQKIKLENNFEDLKSEKDLMLVKFESERSEWEHNEDLLKNAQKGEKDMHEKEKSDWEAEMKKLMTDYESRVEEEIEKQRIVERKAAVTVRELKKQLQSEKKRAEKLQEKLKTVDTDQLVPPNGLALLDVPVQAGLSKDETSSIGSWSLPTEFDGITILTGNEAESIMMKNKQLLETNFQLEEQLRALEKNQIQMSEELANREEILKMRVWNTRPDPQSRKNQNPISGMIFNKINEYANSIEQNPHDQTPTQLKQLNKKLLRMLEEEMTKNVALRKNIEDLARNER